MFRRRDTQPAPGLNRLIDDDLAVHAGSPHVARLAYLDLEDAGPWFDPVAHYGTDRPDLEAVVEHPVANPERP